MAGAITILSRGVAPATASPALWARGPLIRITAMAAGGRPLDKAKMVSAAMRRQEKRGAITGATWPAPSQIIFSATHRMTSRPPQAIQR